MLDQNLQDLFLNTCRKSKAPVTIFLVNGVKLQGTISRFDNYCVMLSRDSILQMVYKHAISTIMPAHPLQLPLRDARDERVEKVPAEAL